MPTERSLANLVTFEKGKSGNPKGRPKGSQSISTILKKMLELDVDYIDLEGNRQTITAKEAIATNMILTATRASKLENRLKATDMIIDRIEGKPKQYIEQRDIAQTNEEAINQLKEIAKQEGISFEELCEREGIEL
jgi:hypothetical protein